MSMLRTPETLGWPEVIVENAVEAASAQRLIGQLRACEVSALAFCRLLERWNRGDAHPPTAGGRDAAHSPRRIPTKVLLRRGSPPVAIAATFQDLRTTF